MKYLALTLFLIFAFSKIFASGDHGHEKEISTSTQTKAEAAHKENGDHDHTDEKQAHDEGEHGHGDEHEEESSQVGPDKGITEASEEKGIKLSPEAEKNFEIEKVAMGKEGRISLHTSAIVTAGVEVNVFRYRDGFYKRIDFNKVAQTNNQITITSKDLTSGDFIVTKGLGFLRIAEIAAFGGAPEGHSH